MLSSKLITYVLTLVTWAGMSPLKKILLLCLKSRYTSVLAIVNVIGHNPVTECTEPFKILQLLFSKFHSSFIHITVFFFKTVKKKAQEPVELFQCFGTWILKIVQIFHGDLNISEEQLDKNV